MTASLSDLRSAMAARCCWLLLLALATRSESVETFGVLEHRPRHLDVVVEGEHAHDAGRRGRHVGEPDRQLGARLGLDRGCELGDHLVEQVDLLYRIAVGAGQEQVGNARQHLVALGIVAVRQRTLEFVDQGRLGRHGLLARCIPGHVEPQRNGFAPGRARACAQAFGLGHLPWSLSARSTAGQNGRPVVKKRFLRGGRVGANNRTGGQVGPPS